MAVPPIDMVSPVFALDGANTTVPIPAFNFPAKVGARADSTDKVVLVVLMVPEL